MRTYGPNRSRLWGFVILAVVSLVTVALFVALAMRSAADSPSTASGSSGTGTTTDSTPSATPSVTPTPTITPAPIVVPAPSPTPEPATPTVAFLGDSYAAGVGATSATKRWTTLLSTALGWKEVNLARAGTGFVTNVTVNAQATCGLEYCATIADKAADAIALQPDIVVVSGGRFDSNQPVADVKAALTSTLQRLAEGLPNAKLIVISPIWDATTPPNTVLVMSDELATATNGANGTYINIGQPLQGRTARLVKGGVDANDSGHLAIERAVLAGLAKAGISD